MPRDRSHRRIDRHRRREKRQVCRTDHTRHGGDGVEAWVTEELCEIKRGNGKQRERDRGYYYLMVFYLKTFRRHFEGSCAIFTHRFSAVIRLEKVVSDGVLFINTQQAIFYSKF